MAELGRCRLRLLCAGLKISAPENDTITNTQILEAIQAVDANATMEDAETVLMALDENGDGTLNVEELMTMVQELEREESLSVYASMFPVSELNGVWTMTADQSSGMAVYRKGKFKLYHCDADGEDNEASADRWHILEDGKPGCKFFGLCTGRVEGVKKWYIKEGLQSRSIHGFIQTHAMLGAACIIASDFEDARFNGVWVPSATERFSGRPVYTYGSLRLYCCNRFWVSDATKADRWHVQRGNEPLMFGFSNGEPGDVAEWSRLLPSGMWKPAEGQFTTSGSKLMLKAKGFTLLEAMNGEWQSSGASVSSRPVFVLGSLRMSCTDIDSVDNPSGANVWRVEEEGNEAQCLAYGCSRDMPDAVPVWNFLSDGKWVEDPDGDLRRLKYELVARNFAVFHPEMEGVWHETGGRYSGRPVYKRRALQLVATNVNDEDDAGKADRWVIKDAAGRDLVFGFTNGSPDTVTSWSFFVSGEWRSFALANFRPQAATEAQAEEDLVAVKFKLNPDLDGEWEFLGRHRSGFPMYRRMVFGEETLLYRCNKDDQDNAVGADRWHVSAAGTILAYGLGTDTPDSVTDWLVLKDGTFQPDLPIVLPASQYAAQFDASLLAADWSGVKEVNGAWEPAKEKCSGRRMYSNGPLTLLFCDPLCRDNAQGADRWHVVDESNGVVAFGCTTDEPWDVEPGRWTVEIDGHWVPEPTGGFKPKSNPMFGLDSDGFWGDDSDMFGYDEDMDEDTQRRELDRRREERNRRREEIERRRAERDTRREERGDADGSDEPPLPVFDDDELEEIRERERKRPSESKAYNDKLGLRFLEHVVPAKGGDKEIEYGLNDLAQGMHWDPRVIKKFKAEYEQNKEDGDESFVALSKALVYLYTVDSWVYRKMNEALRNDLAPVLKRMAPYIRGLIAAYKPLKQFAYSGVVYRRMKLSEEQVAAYESAVNEYPCLWSGFTSTTSKFHLEDLFGPILFKIDIPESLDCFAIDISPLSEFPQETEVLLPPYAALAVTSVDRNPNFQEYPNCQVVVHMRAVFVAAI